MDKKNILFLLNKECTYLPPFMTILDVLSEGYSLKVISYETNESAVALTNLYSDKDITFLSTERQPMSVTSITERCKRKVKRLAHIKSKFHKEALRLLENEKFDLLWVIHENTLYEFQNYLLSNDFNYIVTLYELNDHRPDFLKKLKQGLQKAKEVIVPEYNRACILRTWEGLSKTPTVVPNKPLNHPRLKNIPNKYSNLLEDKKIILYQGYIHRSRNLDALCRACNNYSDYSIVLMGSGDTDYIEELKREFPRIIHIPFVSPPEHLYITSYAHIAIVKYDFVVLNAIFCAPNKTWEYTGFGIPVLCHDIPGLRNTIGKFEAGVCCNMDNENAIRDAIHFIDSNYENFRTNALKFYNSFNIQEAICGVVKRNIL